MFVDEKELYLKAGKGGDGAVLFRREKYVPRGGPDGGDGGRGGDVVLVAKHNLHALNHLAYTTKFLAQDGLIGGHEKSTGKSADALIVEVPCGTDVVDAASGDLIISLQNDGDTFLACRGGNGGWGNWHFRSSIQQVPKRANPGLPGEERTVRLVLKLIADIGLVGLPNAGKSTLLSVVTAARPKIANYPFTTLEPQLGVATVTRGREQVSVVIADLPGLIEGAGTGKGLGTKFLKHVERTRHIVHCIDVSLPLDEMLAAYTTIRAELAIWSEVLAAKPETIALTKIELVTPEELAEKRAALAELSGHTVATISSQTREGLVELLTSLV
jgi:GTPase